MLTPAHPFFPRFRELMREAAASPPVYDLGTSRRFAREVGLVRDLFDERQYLAGGYRPAAGPDACDFHCDLHALDGLADGVAGAVLCLEVLEHVERPEQAARELARVLRPGGLLVLAVPFLAAYHGKRRARNPVYDAACGLDGDHGHDGYGDFWRFTHEGLGVLLGSAGFRRVEVFPTDGALLSRLFLLRLGSWLLRTPPLLRLAGWLDRPRLGRSTTLHFVRAER